MLCNSFSRTSEVVRAIKRDDRRKNVTIACTDAFAAMWLIPRMPDFWVRFPDIAVDHLISDHSRDYRRAEVELRVRYGLAPGRTRPPSFCSTTQSIPYAELASPHSAGTQTAEALPEFPLLHVDWVDPEWADWDEVFRRSGIPHGRIGRRFSKFSVALEAAQANQGVAVGWYRLVRHLLKEGRLVRLTTFEMRAPGGYYLTWNDHRTLSPAAESSILAAEDGRAGTPSVLKF